MPRHGLKILGSSSEGGHAHQDRAPQVPSKFPEPKMSFPSPFWFLETRHPFKAPASNTSAISQKLEPEHVYLKQNAPHILGSTLPTPRNSRKLRFEYRDSLVQV